MPIPDFDHNHVIPPHLGNPSKGGDISPFECTTLELCQKFSTSKERIEILQKFLDFRKRTVNSGVKVGFQWLDGSFLENIEKSEGRNQKSEIWNQLYTIHYQLSIINEINITCKNVTKDTTFNFKYEIQNLPAIVEISSKTDIPVVGIIVTKIVAQIISKTKIIYKAIVLDLDDTLWNGTLSEVGIDKIKENLQSEQGATFIAFMKFVKSLANELGIFITICSRNDSKMVESTIEELDDNIFPLKNQIDYIIANNNDKSENIRKIAPFCQIQSYLLTIIR